MDYELNKRYKIEDFSGIFYTATITRETETHIFFIDWDGLRNQLSKEEIKRSREMLEWTTLPYLIKTLQIKK